MIQILRRLVLQLANRLKNWINMKAIQIINNKKSVLYTYKGINKV